MPLIGPVAQLGERHIRIVEVVGSIPIRSTNKPMKSIRIGIAQINPTVGAYAANTKKILSNIEKAHARGMDWVIFSEMALCGYPTWDLAIRPAFVAQGMKYLDKIVRKTRNLKPLVIVGYIEPGPKGSAKSYNALAVIQNGKILHKQYKTLLPTYDVFLEQIFFLPAIDHKIFHYGKLPVGACICEDIWDENYEVKPARILQKKGARVIINISASPYSTEIPAVRRKLVSQKAKHNQTHFIYVNQVGGQDDLIFDGRSLVAAPDGEIIHESPAFCEELSEVVIDLDPKKVKTKSSNTRTRLDRTAEMYQALTLGVHDYVTKNRFKKVVIGLSGGIDSALTAAIAVDALGSKSVVGVSMPSRYSSAGSRSDAKDLAMKLGIEFRTRPIKSVYDTFLRENQKARKVEKQASQKLSRISLAEENLQARIRGLMLMYFSNDENFLLLSTGNKSELAMGYCTMYGDMSGGLCVLGDIYKTEVYRLSQYRNAISQVIPEDTITKPPSAELRPNQKDQDSLPPYDLLDAILKDYIEAMKSRDQILRKYAKEKNILETVDFVLRRLDVNEYKRRQAPPILRVTGKAWFGRRMPITNHFREA